MEGHLRHKLATGTALVAAAAFGCPAAAGVLFEEVTQAAGLTYSGPSWGAAWGDVNGDGWPDVWIGHHAKPPSLFLNEGDGTFTDIIDTVVGPTGGDAHGMAWADFDGDGDQDMVNLGGASAGSGSASSNRLYVNQSGVLTESSLLFGVTYSQGRGRTPLWFDWNGDGLLDLLVANAPRSDGTSPTAVFTQAGGSFVMDNAVTGLSTTVENVYAQIMHLGMFDRPVLLIQRSNFPERLYDYSQTPFMDRLGQLDYPSVTQVRDSAVADFDGDLLLDMYLARLSFNSGIGQRDAQTVVADINASNTEHGVVFSTAGRLTITVDDSSGISESEIFLGRGGRHPTSSQFSVSATSRGVEGLLPHKGGVDSGAYFGYRATDGTWRLFISDAKARITIQSDTPIADLMPVNFDNAQGAKPDSLLIQTASGFQDVSQDAGVDAATACESVAAADLDNDMDVDIYLVCRGSALNWPNLLLLNDGEAHFTPVVDAGGAAGSESGRGDSAALADFDRDGFVDILVTNGRGGSPFNDGPDQLFRNLGNDNNWIQIDLEGTQSNADGIGALVYVTAGGKTQVRLQDGGIHRAAQDLQRLHFGLAAAQAVDRIVVEWPNGTTQELTDQAVNAIMTITQPSNSRDTNR